jgi:acyl-CoA synthetase (AMP-forming)/AMP-acid ligase II
VDLYPNPTAYPVFLLAGSAKTVVAKSHLHTPKRGGADGAGRGDRFGCRWMPDDVAFVADIPHTATGKMEKKRLRATFKDYTLPSVLRARL